MGIIRFYRTLRDGRPRTIALSEAAAWRSLETFWEFDANERECWSVKQVERDVPEVLGVVHCWGTDGVSLPHVHWICPKCGEEHHTDLEPSESNPALWFCEMGDQDDVFLVTWRREQST